MRWKSINLLYVSPFFFVLLMASAYYVGRISPVEGVKFIIIIAAMDVMLILLLRQNYDEFLYLGIFAIVLGWRTIPLGAHTRLTGPIIVLVFLALLIASGKNTSKTQPHASPHIPTILKLFSVYVAVLSLFAIITNSDLDAIISWTIPYLFGIVCFFVLPKLITSTEKVKRALQVYTLVAALIGLSVMLELYFPAIALKFSVFSEETGFTYTAFGGFQRAGFIMWGSTAGSLVLFHGLLFSYVLYLNEKNSLVRFLYILVFVLCLAAIYFSGNRTVWFSVLASFVTFSAMLLLRDTRTAGWTLLLIAVVAVLTILYVPTDFITRIEIAINATDGSVAERYERWNQAIALITRYPLQGQPFAMLPRTHNVFLELGVRFGIPSSILFAAFFIQVLRRDFQQWSHSTHLDLQTFRLTALFIALWPGWLIQFSVEIAISSLIFCSFYWIPITLAWVFPDIVARSEAATEPALQ